MFSCMPRGVQAGGDNRGSDERRKEEFRILAVGMQFVPLGQLRFGLRMCTHAFLYTVLNTRKHAPAHLYPVHTHCDKHTDTHCWEGEAAMWRKGVRTGAFGCRQSPVW